MISESRGGTQPPSQAGADPAKGPTLHPAPPGSLGIYVHFPWCLAKCPYCDFLSVVGNDQGIPHEAYADAVLRELEARLPKVAGRAIHSIFIGGGTPSLWRSGALARVLRALCSAFDHDPTHLEVTAECNPSSFDQAKAELLLGAGITRFSIGLQSLDDKRLGFLGRLHNAEQGLSALRAAVRSGAPRVSCDLIYGVAEQSPEQAAAEADTVAGEGVGHVSAYALTIEDNTRFGDLARRGQLPLLDDGQVAESFDSVAEALARHGLEHYEISNFAREGQQCSHNLGYWRGQDYLGLGCGAWGTITTSGQRRRYRNLQNPERYAAWAGQEPEHPTEGLVLEAIDNETALKERILLGLRLREGIELEALSERLGQAPLSPERRRAIARLQARSQIHYTEGKLTIPRASWLFADAIIRELL